MDQRVGGGVLAQLAATAAICTQTTPPSPTRSLQQQTSAFLVRAAEATSARAASGFDSVFDCRRCCYTRVHAWRSSRPLRPLRKGVAKATGLTGFFSRKPRPKAGSA